MLNRKQPFLLLLVTFFSSCEKEHLGDCFKSTGSIVTEVRPAGNIHSIDVSHKVDVTVREGPAESILVEAGENIIGGITTRMENGTLFIDNENKCNWMRSYSNPIRVYVTGPGIRHIVQHGNGDITSDGLLHADTLTLEVWNSGNIRVETDCQFLNAKQHVSVGDVDIKGSAGELYVYNAGNGFAWLSGLVAQTAQVDSRGTGDTQVRVDSLLSYSISGSGNIYLYGPATANGTGSSSGRLYRKQ